MSQKLIEINDFHKRGNSLKLAQKHIKEQKGISVKNAEILQSYDTVLQKQFLKNKLSLSGWHKSLTEAFAFAKLVKKDLDKLERKDIETWFGYHESRLMEGKITAWTIKKYYSQARKLMRFVFKIEDEKQFIPWFDWARKELPNKPNNVVLAKDLPSQADIKKLIVALRNLGNKTAIRDASIIALCNDVGCRISEALSITNDCLTQEKNYLVVTFPVSKTMPRTVISCLAKPYLEEWAKISPNYNKGDGALFFCNGDGEHLRYTALRKHLLKALEKTGVRFPKNKATHMFRKLFASRSYNWPTIIRNYWLGWASGISDVYTSIDHRACVEHYFKMLEAEKNPMYQEKAHWEKDKDTQIESLEERLGIMEENLAKALKHYNPKVIAR